MFNNFKNISVKNDALGYVRVCTSRVPPRQAVFTSTRVSDDSFQKLRQSLEFENWMCIEIL